MIATLTASERGIGFVGAPVFGRPEAAPAGKLFILGAGEASARQKCQPQRISSVSSRGWM